MCEVCSVSLSNVCHTQLLCGRVAPYLISAFPLDANWLHPNFNDVYLEADAFIEKNALKFNV